MLFIIVAIAALQGVIVLTLIVLAFRRTFLNYYKKYSESRKRYFEQHVLNLLEDPQKTTILERGIRPFDRRFIEELLLQLAVELTGQERADMTNVFERLGYVSNEKKRLQSRTWWQRREAAIKLGIMRSNESAIALIRAVKDDSEVVRLAAVRALSQMNHPDGVKTLLDVMQDTENWTGARVLEIMVNVGQSARQDVLSRLGIAMEPRVRLLLIQLCGLMRWSEAVPLLIPLLEDADPEARASAVRSLGNIGDGTVTEYLETMCQDPCWEVRAEATHSLGLLQDSSTVSSLSQSLCDENWWVRYNAANSLYQLGEKGIHALQNIRSSGDSPNAGMAAQILAERELGVQRV